MERSAVFSDDRVFRYELRRVWDRWMPPVLFIGFNPSTADEDEDDPTIRRCIGYAKTWGYGGLLMGNLFAFRATDPKKLPTRNPVGEPTVERGKGWRNDESLRQMADQAALVVAAWGAIRPPVGWEQRGRRVRDLLGPRLHALGTSVEGHPLHPLYQPSDLRPIPLGR